MSVSSRPHGLQATGSCVHGIFQARVLEWGTIAFSAFLSTRVLFAFSRVLPELKGHSYINMVLLHNLRRWEGRYFLSLLSSLPPPPTPFILQMENWNHCRMKWPSKIIIRDKTRIKIRFIILSLLSLPSILEIRGHEAFISYKHICCPCELWAPRRHNNLLENPGLNSAPQSLPGVEWAHPLEFSACCLCFSHTSDLLVPPWWTEPPIASDSSPTALSHPGLLMFFWPTLRVFPLRASALGVPLPETSASRYLHGQLPYLLQISPTQVSPSRWGSPLSPCLSLHTSPFLGTFEQATHFTYYSCCYWVTKSCPALWDPMDCSMPSFPVLNYLPEFPQTYVLWVGDAT